MAKIADAQRLEKKTYDSLRQRLLVAQARHSQQALALLARQNAFNAYTTVLAEV